MKHILLLNGPNLNLLGKRENEHYGCASYDDIIKKMQNIADSNNIKLSHFQSNAEDKLIDRIQLCLKDKVDYMIINPAAYTHTSIALRDAILAVNIPFIEIHISNIFKREKFRKKSYFSDISQGIISGFGYIGYEVALNTAIKLIVKN